MHATYINFEQGDTFSMSCRDGIINCYGIISDKSMNEFVTMNLITILDFLQTKGFNINKPE